MFIYFILWLLVRGNTLVDSINDKCSTCVVETRVPSVKVVKPEDLCRKPIEIKTPKIFNTLQYYCICNTCPTGSTNASEESSSNTETESEVHSIRRSVGVQCSGLDNILDNTFKICPTPIKKSVNFDDNIKNVSF